MTNFGVAFFLSRAEGGGLLFESLQPAAASPWGRSSLRPSPAGLEPATSAGGFGRPPLSFR